jgi:ABC-2 type transport system permease protein
VWESLISNFAPGARSLSIQQWAVSVTDALTPATTVESEVGLGFAVVLLVIVTALGATLATARLRTLSVASAE